MEINGWKYYNHAAVPTCRLTESPDLTPIQNGDIWAIEEKKPLLVRYITEFDCGFETNYWYVIKNAPFDLEELSSKYRRSVKTAIKRCIVKQINPKEFVGELYEVYKAAFGKYSEADNELSQQEFVVFVNNSEDSWWASFCADEENRMNGYIICKDYGNYAEHIIAKYHPQYMNYRVSDALHYYVLDYYLNQLGRKFVLSGARNINHKTSVQDYEIDNWKYRKAYCKLHVVLKPRYKTLIRFLYHFRKVFLLFDKITIVHQMNGLLMLYSLSKEAK